LHFYSLFKQEGFIMGLIKKISIVFITAFSTFTFAGDRAELIELDKQWGNAGGPAGFVSEDVIAIGPNGIVGISEMLDQASATPTDEVYTVSGYQIKFLREDVAVMVHSAAGSDPHSSMHVFQKQGDKWLVVANASVPSVE
jgi:hypothetical protein